MRRLIMIAILGFSLLGFSPAHAQITCINNIFNIQPLGISAFANYGSYNDSNQRLSMVSNRAEIVIVIDTNKWNVTSLSLEWSPNDPSVLGIVQLSVTGTQQGAPVATFSENKSGIQTFARGFSYIDTPFNKLTLNLSSGYPLTISSWVRIIELCYKDASAPPTNTAPPVTPTDVTYTPTPVTHTPTHTPVLIISSGRVNRPDLLSGQCRNIYNPCPLFEVAAFATVNLPSPTRRPTIVFTPTPSITPSATPTPTFTPSPTFDPSTATWTPTPIPTDCWDQCDATAVAAFGTAVLNAGSFNVELRDIQGTPVGTGAMIALGGAAGSIFTILRSFANIDHPAGWLISIVVLGIGTSALFWAVTYFMPILIKIAQLLMQMLQILLRVIR